MAKKGYLILENGLTLEGISFGSEKNISGEVVFNTGMVGYPESFTDPSYYGQILTLTYPLIGNYGVPPKKTRDGLLIHFESGNAKIRGLVVSSYIEEASHWEASENLGDWLKKEGIPALSSIDTRTLTKIIREFGVMKGIITHQKPQNNMGLNFYDINSEKRVPSEIIAQQKLQEFTGLNFYDINSENLVPFVSTKKNTKYGNGKYRILFIDCGLKVNQIRNLLKYDTTIIQAPWDYNPFIIKSDLSFDAIFISNGPGDARMMKETIAMLKQALLREIPVFGICLGNQLLALAAGGDIYKLRYGHRGQNQPVKDLSSGKCYITSQNHGFSVVNESLSKDWYPWFTNLNDSTNEGIHHKKLPFFSVQFHPEAAPGPTDIEWLFEYFINIIKKWRKKQ